MSRAPVVLGLDQGTGSSRAVLVTRDGKVVGSGLSFLQRRVGRDGSIDVDAEESYRSIRRAVTALWQQTAVRPERVRAIGLATQRSTSVLYGEDGRPRGPAISWQCQRTAGWFDRAIDKATRRQLQRRTGLPAIPAYAASKLRWLIDHHRPPARDAWTIGTLDSYLLTQLTGTPRTDLTNASRTLLVDLGKRDWSDRTLELFGIPRDRLPPIVPTLGEIGPLRSGALPSLREGIPITASAGDQQASLFASGQRTRGRAKITYGSGAFLLAHAGRERPRSTRGVIRSVAWNSEKHTDYLVEVNVPSSGTVIGWLEQLTRQPFADLLREALRDPRPLDEQLAHLSIIPAFAGLGPLSPDLATDGRISGLGHNDDGPRLALALSSGIALALERGLHAVESCLERRISCVVDGGGSRDDRFLQIQSDLLRRALRAAEEPEGTAFGAAALAWAGLGETPPTLTTQPPRKPKLAAARATRLRERWAHALTALERERRSRPAH